MPPSRKMSIHKDTVKETEETPPAVEVPVPPKAEITDPGTTLGAESENPDGITDPGTTLDS